MKRPLNVRNTSECYVPSSTLVRYLEEKLLSVEIVLDKTPRGEELTKDDRSNRLLLDRRKVDILNKVIFPSMANVIYFLEFVNEHSILREGFENDLKELLGVEQGLGDRSPITRDTFIFGRFVNAAIARGSGTNSSDFRALLLQAMQYIISQEVTNICTAIYGDEMINSVIAPDMSRPLAWVGSISRIYLEREIEELRKGTEDEIKEKEQRQPHRPVCF